MIFYIDMCHPDQGHLNVWYFIDTCGPYQGHVKCCFTGTNKLNYHLVVFLDAKSPESEMRKKKNAWI